MLKRRDAFWNGSTAIDGLSGSTKGGWPTKTHPVDPHWTRYVLERLLARVLEGNVKLPLDVLQHSTRNADTPRLRNPLQTHRHVHAIPEDVATVDDDVTDIDADTELNLLLVWHLGIALGHSALDIKSAANRVHYAAELSQQSISGVLDDPPTVLSDLGIDERAQMVLKPGVRPFFVQAGQPAVTGYIGRENGSEPSLYTLGGQGCTPGVRRQSTPLAARAIGAEG